VWRTDTKCFAVGFLGVIGQVEKFACKAAIHDMWTTAKLT
jgi:hypothetical protein